MNIEHLKEKPGMSEKKKEITAVNIRIPKDTFNNYYINCVRMDISMNKQTILLIEDFNKFLKTKKEEKENEEL